MGVKTIKTWYWVRPVEGVMLASNPLMIFIDEEYAEKMCEKLMIGDTTAKYEVVEIKVEVKDGN